MKKNEVPTLGKVQTDETDRAKDMSCINRGQRPKNLEMFAML